MTDKVKDARMSQAYANGHVDYETFGENCPNPYAQGTEERECWEAGYEDARDYFICIAANKNFKLCEVKRVIESISSVSSKNE